MLCSAVFFRAYETQRLRCPTLNYMCVHVGMAYAHTRMVQYTLAIGITVSEVAGESIFSAMLIGMKGSGRLMQCKDRVC